MAEAFLNELFPDKLEAFSAGIEPGTLNSYAVEAMKETGIDISPNTTKSVKEFIKQRFDYIVTVCDRAKETCPFFPSGLNISIRTLKTLLLLQVLMMKLWKRCVKLEMKLKIG